MSGIPAGKAWGVGTHAPKGIYATEYFAGTTAVNGVYFVEATSAAAGFWAVYGGFYDEHTPMSDPVALRAGYRKPGGAPVGGDFGSGRDVTLQPSGWEAFYVPGPFLGGELIEIRSRGVQAAGKIPLSRATESAAGEGIEFASPGTDKTTSGTIAPNDLFGFGPTLLIADQPVGAQWKPVFLSTDSIGDGQNGAGERHSFLSGPLEAETPPIPYIHGGHSGARAIVIAAGGGPYADICAHVDRVILQPAINDHRFGATWQQIATAYITLATIAVDQGAEGVHLVTSMPDQTSGGLPTFEADRVALHAWVRAGSPMLNGSPVTAGTPGALVCGDAGNPFLTVIEASDLAETARDSGAFKPGMSDDQIHLDRAPKHAIVGQSVNAIKTELSLSAEPDPDPDPQPGAGSLAGHRAALL